MTKRMHCPHNTYILVMPSGQSTCFLHNRTYITQFKIIVNSSIDHMHCQVAKNALFSTKYAFFPEKTTGSIFYYCYLPFLSRFLCTYKTLFLISIRVLALPFPGICTHFADSVLCFPAEFFLCLGCIGIAGCDVAWTAWFDHVWDLNPELSSSFLRAFTCPLARSTTWM